VRTQPRRPYGEERLMPPTNDTHDKRAARSAGHSGGIAARAGRWSARHRKAAIFGWLAFVVASLVIGGSFGTNLIDYQKGEGGVGESGRADKTLAAAFPQQAGEQVLLQSQTREASDPAFKAAAADVQQRLGAVPHVRNVQDPYDPGNEGQISSDERSVLVNFDLAGDSETLNDRVEPTLKAVAAAQRVHPDFSIRQFGDTSANKQLSKAFSDDFKKAERSSLPITLVILVVAFGALVAAGIPLLLAFTAVLATIGLIGPISQIAPVDEAISSVILLIGLAVGIDYTMFYLRREREERAAGNTPRDSLEAAAATSGRAVLISGLTVIVAMSGMYLAGATTFQSFATGTIVVVAVAVLGSLTVLPALLAWLGDRVEKGRVPLLRRLKSRRPEGRLWAHVVDLVLRRPLVSAIMAGGLLVVLAIPALGLHTATPGVETLPKDLEVVQTYDRIQAAFPGGPLPAQVVVSAANVNSPQVKREIAELRVRAARNRLFRQPITVDVSPRRDVAEIAIPLTGDGSDARSNAALSELRSKLVPETVGRVQDATVDVTGYTASSKDLNDTMKSHAPWVFAFVLSAAFALLLVTFRSLVIPLKAILLNLLSVGAAYGIVVWIFQHGHLEGVLGFESNGAITSWLPLFLFVVLFGLSMDYHVFILTRIREAFDRGMSTEDAVADGIKSTAGVVTSAAVVMVAVFGIFASLSMLEFKQMGVGLAAAVLIDATLIRGVLLPATMTLLGDWNWYLPRWLAWLPRLGGAEAGRAEQAEPQVQPEPAPEPVPV
jgi:uncharacterized membrane protein YdfJ with MMPL/SSD domain